MFCRRLRLVLRLHRLSVHLVNIWEDPEAAAFELLEQMMPWAHEIAAIGMGGPEVGHPPSKFTSFFRECRTRGFRVVIHAGEEGPASYVREALNLGADRIDHGNSCIDDPALVRTIAELHGGTARALSQGPGHGSRH